MIRAHPRKVTVTGSRKGKTEREFQIHELAFAIPPMTESERERFRASIMESGVKVPLLIYEDKVLDGRHRLYYASELNKPVTLEYFIGTREEAKREVQIRNVHRRHLNSSQRALTAVRLFGEKVAKETAEAINKGREHSHEARRLAPSKTAEPNIPNRSQEWHQKVARMANEAGLNVTPSAVKALKEVIGAPATEAAIDRGEIKTVNGAHTAALVEKKKPPSTEIFAVQIQSVTNRLGKCIEHLNSILRDCEMPVGITPEKVSERIGAIEDLIRQVRQAMRDRRVIN